MDVASSIQASSRHGLRVVATTVDQPRLTNTNPIAISAFLWEYDQYAWEVKERSQQIAGDNRMSTDIPKPFHIKIRVNSEWLESVVDLGFIPAAKSYEAQRMTSSEST